jgi:hypothetical protein
MHHVVALELFLLCFVFCLLLSCSFFALFGSSFLVDLESGLTILLDLLLIPANDHTRNESDLIHLRNIRSFGGVFAFVIEPILQLLA